MPHMDTRSDKPDHRADRSEASCLAAARHALFQWAEIVSSGNVDDVLSLYAHDAILVPTLSDEIGDRDDERRRYFQEFLSNENLRCTITTQKKRVSQKLGTVVIGGLYTFRFRRDGLEQTVPARFPFTFEEIDGRWLITGHHSSRLSEAL